MHNADRTRFNSTWDELRFARGQQVSDGLRAARVCGQCGVVEDETVLVVDGVDNSPPVCENCVVATLREINYGT